MTKQRLENCLLDLIQWIIEVYSMETENQTRKEICEALDLTEEEIQELSLEYIDDEDDEEK